MFVALKSKKPRHGSNENIHQQKNDKEDAVLIFNRISLRNIKSEIKPIVATWMELKFIIVNEVNQIEKNIYHMILLMCGI